MTYRAPSILAGMFCVGWLLWAPMLALAQGTGGGIPLLPQFQNLNPPAADGGEPVVVSAKLLVQEEAPRRGQLMVTAELGPKWHIYSVTQPKGGPLRTQIQPELPPGVELAGAFTADHAPEILPPQPGIFSVNSEVHHGTVTWTADLNIAPDVDLASLSVKGILKGQVCSDEQGCIPIRRETGSFTAQAELVTFLAAPPNAATAEQTPAPPAPAGADDATGAEVPPPPSPVGGSSDDPSQSGAVHRTGPDATESAALNGGRSATEDAANGKLGSGEAGSETAAPDAGGAAFLDKIQTEQQTSSTPIILLFALLGGFVLNFMPCVLPVIGLKIMSFVEQAGEDRRRVLWLNVWYSLGVWAVFLILATVIGTLGLGWGQQFGNDRFSITLTAIVFAMALSFMGVWDIPIPGFVTTRGAQQLAEKEGLTGAFFKGVLATLLATPCSAPGITPALAWSANKPLPLVYLVFTCMALGMSAPYLVLGAKPELLRFLPKPGAWMETFKELMGFVLMATVVFLLSFISLENLLPSVALLFAVWAACWWIGRLKYGSPWSVRLRAWGVAASILLVVGGYAFASYRQFGDMTLWGLRGTMAYRLEQYAGARLAKAGESQGASTSKLAYELPWEEYSTERLVSLLNSKRTVMVDFTAHWCATCKTLEQTVLNTRPIREAVDKLGIVTLKADYDLPEVKALADRLGRRAIPILAIFPEGSPERPILLPTAYSRQKLLKALEEATASRPATALTSANE